MRINLTIKTLYNNAEADKEPLADSFPMADNLAHPKEPVAGIAEEAERQSAEVDR
jgi:hypothetical protein